MAPRYQINEEESKIVLNYGFQTGGKNSDFFNVMSTLLKEKKKCVEYPKAAQSKHFSKVRSFQKNSIKVEKAG